MDNSALPQKKNAWQTFFTNRSNIFVLEILGVYACWKVLHYFMVSTTGQLNRAWLYLVNYMGTLYAKVASFLLNLMGEQTVSRGISVMYPKAVKYIRIEDHCLAIPATIIFTALILLFPGKRADKLWFIPLGIFMIVLINLARIIFVCQTFVYNSTFYFEVNHSLIYVVITYSLILGMTVWWMKRLKPASIKPKQPLA